MRNVGTNVLQIHSPERRANPRMQLLKLVLELLHTLAARTHATQRDAYLSASEAVSLVSHGKDTAARLPRSKKHQL